MSELRDRIAEAIYQELSGQYGDFVTPNDAAAAVIDALGLHYVESEDGAWRVVSAWQGGDPPHVF